MNSRQGVRIAQGGFAGRAIRILGALLFLCVTPQGFAVDEAELRERFREAWVAARSGQRDRFEALGPELRNYSLYPYWQYEDYRHRRRSVPPGEMAAFLDAHRNWAFHRALRTSWLKTLGKQGNWQALVDHGENSGNTEVRCYRARARLELGQAQGLESEARALWTVGRSQPDACDPLFAWLVDQGGVTPELAWERIRLAMEAGNPRLTLYLGRFLPLPDREWLDRWQRLDEDRYRRLDRATAWRDTPLTRMIAAHSLTRLSRMDAARALALYDPLARHFSWSDEVRGDLAREVALWAAVALEDPAIDFIRTVPAGYRNDQLHEWWARAAMARGDWSGVLEAIEGLENEAADDDRWRYWRARALLETGQAEAGVTGLEALATRTNYYGFLSADALRQPYTICPVEPGVSDEQVEALASQVRFRRALELHRVEIDNWAAAEWSNAARALPTQELKVAAGLARREGWHDRVIFALGDSGELKFYEWRFPVVYTEAIGKAAQNLSLEPAYILGIMRSESALMAHARSSANALGLLQVTPGTARDLARKHGLAYSSSSQLLDPDTNIRFGTLYLRDLLDDHDDNPVLVSGAYNAGPNAVARWRDSRSVDEAAQWIETLPYYETRDYIPRVLTFTTLYDWRLGNPVRRLSSRMPGIESGTIDTDSTAQVVCRPAEPVVAAGGP